MKKTIKIFFVIVIIILLQLKFNIIYATNSSIQINSYDNINLNNSESNKSERLTKTGFWGNLLDMGGSFLNTGRDEITNNGTEVNESSLETTSNNIFNAFFGIGVVLTVIVGGVLGIKFMLASAEEKADIKNAMIPYIIGCIVIFGAFTIWKIAVNILQAMV